MEITIEQEMMGHERRDQILERYGSREALEEQAAQGDRLAKSDLVSLDLLEEDPRRLEVKTWIRDIITLEKDEIQLLTPARLELLEHLVTEAGDENVTQLAATLGRDKKNVSEDLSLLADLGLIFYKRQGRSKIPRVLGTEIHIRLGPGEAHV